jgi:hypothetical protein
MDWLLELAFGVLFSYTFVRESLILQNHEKQIPIFIASFVWGIARFRPKHVEYRFLGDALTEWRRGALAVTDGAFS